MSGQGGAEAMARMGGGPMPPDAAAQYGNSMYGMMGGGFQGGMMGYGYVTKWSGCCSLLFYRRIDFGC